MSRPSEIANSLLHQYYKQKQSNLLPTSGTPRPKRIQSVTSIAACEKFRSFVIREISVKITKINDPTTLESQVRDLNDEINKLVNEKLSWEYHIKELGGPDYVVFSKRQLSKELSVRNYRYFGRSKDLPDVKELMELKNKKSKTVISNEKQLLKYVNENVKKLDLKEYLGQEEKKVKKKANKVTKKSVPKAKRSFKFDEFNPPMMEEIEKILVEKKKQELKQKLGIA